MSRISIVNGRLLDSVAGVDGQQNLYIADGKVVGVGQQPAGFQADRTIDANGCWVIPGAVDLAARLREPGIKYRAGLETELAAAAAGGVTSLCCPPDTDPPLDEPGLVRMLRQRARERHGTRLYPLGALTIGLQGEVITEMTQLVQAGCIGLSQAPRLPVNTDYLLRAMQYASTFGFTVWLHPIDAHIGLRGVAHSGAVASRLGLTSIPVSTETIALHIIFELVRQTRCAVHLCRLSSAAGVALVEQAKKEGLPITCDVAIHHLHLTDIDIGHFDSFMRVDPPFRGQRDRDALRHAVASGVIDAVCSDHTPVNDDDKQLPFAEAEPGVCSLELLLPLLFKWAAEDDVDPLTALARITAGPATILGISAGALTPENAADVCVIAPDKQWRVQPAGLRSMCHHSPFLDVELAHQIKTVLVDGQVVFDGATEPAR